jgi:hypothetical protein
MRVGFLAHYQPMDARPSTFISKDVAEQLLARLAAEKISSKVIRAFPPDSSFLVLKPILHNFSFIPGKLPRVELPGLHLEFPKNCEGVSMAAVRSLWDWRDTDEQAAERSRMFA